MKPDFYYLESDGQVFLIKKGKRWCFPTRLSQLPAKFEPIFVMPVDGHSVLFAKPILKNHPAHWFHKDLVIGRSDIDPIVQRAINRSLARAASKVAIIERGRVLMVRAARGLAKGMWNLPGGFIGYGEHPAESAHREVKEELGIKVKLTRLLGVYSELFPGSGGYMISFVYQGKRRKGPIQPHPEEIECYEWLPIREAMTTTRNPFAKAGLHDYLKKRSR